MNTAAPLSLLGGTGFILGTYARLNAAAVYVEPRASTFPSYDNVLYGISTVSNYHPLHGDLYTDVNTNLVHLMNVLPNVRGRFTFLSSWFTAGSNNWGHHPAWRAKEEHLCNPKGFYSATKLCAEQLIESYVRTVNEVGATSLSGPTSYQILRLSNVIGNDPRAGKQKNALEYLLSLVVSNKDVPVYEGANYRDYLHVEDTCAAIECVMDKGLPNQIYNVGRGESHKLEDIIQYAIDKTGSSAKIVRIPVPPFHQIVQVPDFFMDVNKLRSLGFTPKYSIWESVDKVLAGLKT